jgi:hypothetical protein
MLVTVYKVLYPGLEQMDQYYKWKIQIDPPVTVPRTGSAGRPRKPRGTARCPGCAKKLSYNQVYGDAHKCPGTLTDNPVKPRAFRRPPTNSELRQHWIDYVRLNDHPITFSESGETDS